MIFTTCFLDRHYITILEIKGKIYLYVYSKENNSKCYTIFGDFLFYDARTFPVPFIKTTQTNLRNFLDI